MTDPDDLEPLLAPRPAPPPRPGFDAALFAHTERTLARGRQVRQWGRAAVVVSVFAVGWLTGWGLRPEPPGPQPLPAVAHVQVVPVTVVVPVPVAASGPGPVAVAEPELATPGAAELLAEQADDPAQAARLYRLAGDRYLLDRQDFRNARRCYRLFLARAGDPGLAPAGDDSWLLAELKVSVLRERSDATRSDG